MNEYVIGQFPIRQMMDRFSDFGDSIIQDIRISMAGGEDNYYVTLILYAIDDTVQDDVLGGYVNVTFSMFGIEEFKVDYSTHYNLQIISSGFNIVFINDFIHLDFYGVYAKTPEELRKSRLYFICKKCVVKVEPI